MWRFYQNGIRARNRLQFMSAFNVHNDVYHQTGFKFFVPLGQFIAVQPQAWKWSEPRATLTQAIFPWGALRNTSRVTAPNQCSLSSYGINFAHATPFWYISMRYCKTSTSNFLRRRCMEGTRRRIFLSLSELRCGPQKFNPWEIHLRWPF